MLVDRTFTQVRDFLLKQAHRPFLKRYLKRDEILREIASCDTALSDALSMFSVRPPFSLVPLGLTCYLRSSKSRCAS